MDVAHGALWFAFAAESDEVASPYHDVSAASPLDLDPICARLLISFHIPRVGMSVGSHIPYLCVASPLNPGKTAVVPSFIRVT